MKKTAEVNPSLRLLESLLVSEEKEECLGERQGVFTSYDSGVSDRNRVQLWPFAFLQNEM